MEALFLFIILILTVIAVRVLRFREKRAKAAKAAGNLAVVHQLQQTIKAVTAESYNMAPTALVKEDEDEDGPEEDVGEEDGKEEIDAFFEAEPALLDQAAVVKAYKKLKSVPKVAKLLKLTYPHVREILNDNGVKVRGPGRPKTVKARSKK